MTWQLATRGAGSASWRPSGCFPKASLEPVFTDPDQSLMAHPLPRSAACSSHRRDAWRMTPRSTRCPVYLIRDDRPTKESGRPVTWTSVYIAAGRSAMQVRCSGSPCGSDVPPVAARDWGRHWRSLPRMLSFIDAGPGVHGSRIELKMGTRRLRSGGIEICHAAIFSIAKRCGRQPKVLQQGT